MTPNASMKIDIPGVDFEQMAREAIAARLNQALIGSDDTIVKIVASALSQKVNEKGVVGSSSYDNKIPFVEWMAHDLIRKATLDVMTAKAEAMKPALEKAIEAELRRCIKSTAKSLAQAFVDSASSQWNLKVTVTPVER